MPSLTTCAGPWRIRLYLSEFERVAERAFCQWNREPSSPSFGCFDRAHWGWKKTDFPDATLQYGVKLCLEYARRRQSARPSALSPANSEFGNWLTGYVNFVAQIQQRDGSFDQCYPHERSPGVFYDILSTLLYVYRSPYLDPISHRKLEGVLDRGLGFAEKSDETHGEIANHLIEYAYELLLADRELGRESARRKANYYLERTLKLFHQDEGWFEEYGGPDPGYQTRTLRYLYKCAEILNDPQLWSIVYKAARFVEQVLMPDGSLHPMLGVRSTAVLYPAAFEKLAGRDKAFGPLAARIRRGWQDQRVPLPSWLDFENGMRLADDALEAHDAQCSDLLEIPEPLGQTVLPRAGLVIWRGPRQTVATACRLGGATVVYHDRQLVAEEAGYLVQSPAGPGVSRMSESGKVTQIGPEGVQVNVQFFRSLHDELTPARFVLLRLLNLTVLRFEWVAELFKKIVVNRLMTGRKPLEVFLDRRVEVSEHKVMITDQLRRSREPSSPEKWFRARRLVGTHMATSRYFQQQELELSGEWLKQVDWSRGLQLELIQEIGLESRKPHAG